MAARGWWVTFVLLLLLGRAAAADSLAAPQSSKTVSANGEFVFVSLVSDSYGRNELNDQYPRSGLYRVGDSRKPLWASEWGGPCEVASDGKHVVFWGPWAGIGDNGETDALYFVREGKPVGSYKIKELVRGPMPRSVSHYQWRSRSRFDDALALLHVTTYAGPDGSEGVTYTFDLATGVIIGKNAPSPLGPIAMVGTGVPFPLWGWVAIGGVLLLGCVGVLMGLHRRKRPSGSAVIVDSN